MLEHIKNIFEFLNKYASASARGGPQLIMQCHVLLLIPEDFMNLNLGGIDDLQKKLKDLRDDFNACVTSEHYRVDRTDSK